MNKDVALGASPAMAQWFAIKADHADALLFFRMGDFYELFFEDAQAASAALDIALTARGSHQGVPVAMCGVPVSQAEVYLARLIRRGFRVAIVEQMEDPAAAKARGAKGPLARAVVRLVTPGTLTEESLLEAGQANFLAVVVQTSVEMALAWLDISTGLFETQACDAASLAALLGRVDPAEILAPESVDLGNYARRRVASSGLAMQSPTQPATARRDLAAAFGAASLEAFGVFTDAEALAAATALAYVKATQMGAMPRLSRPVAAGGSGQLLMDAATRASLEITRARNGAEAGSLLGAVKRTVSAAGARKLASWLAAPITDLAALQSRQTGWLALRDAPAALDGLRHCLRGAPDLARALARIALNRAGPRDLAAVRGALDAAAQTAALLPAGVAVLDAAAKALAPAPGLAETLARALAEPAPLKLDEGTAIKLGFDAELDAERRLRDDTRQVIAAFQTELATRYAVASLKIRHHAQLGYVLEAPAVAVEKLRENPELILRQGMANGARFTHPELSALDQRISEAASRAMVREKLVFTWLIKQVLVAAEALAECAEALALLDVLQSAASLAANNRWCQPALSDDEAFEITAGRHPVVEAALPPGVGFVPNDCDLSPPQRLMLLTGPNMAGKSTYLRQNALLTILAQSGLPVPAEAMKLGLVDRLFSRVGGADDLASGRSTFMVEMIEAAAILHQAGPKSFVIVDEIGRGTGTRDGLAIAQAVLEALHGNIRCRAIFATHFHELCQLSEALPRLQACTMRVKEWRGEVVFMHEVAAGAAQRSWGVHVARLAGVPESVAKRAELLLKAAERTGPASGMLPLFASTEMTADSAIETELAALDPDKMTPREAHAALYELRAKLMAHRDKAS
ncbi:MAG TPA: DNA mismatch repair protein MutS [Acidocella sp.]|nr:MAG: DNA mismatch repair protein MutS [Acidocella sp. 20-58-15]HQT38696.1 DNA mismatch repair protein MutS [Acidocella sp.]